MDAAEAQSVSVLFGGPSPEHDVSILTGLQASRTLSSSSLYKEVHAIYWNRGGDFFEVSPTLEAEEFLGGLSKGAVKLSLFLESKGGFVVKGGRLKGDKLLSSDVVVNCCHGRPGEDGSLQAALDLAGIAYTGPTVAGAALGMDKLTFGALMAQAGLPVLPRALLTRNASSKEFPFEGPYILKPRYGGSSIGIDVVKDLPTAIARLETNSHLQEGAVVEPYKPELYDIQIGVRNWPTPSVSAIEKPLRGGGSSEILGYADKYAGGEGMVSAARELPANLPSEVAQRVRDYAMTVAQVAGVRGVARVDFLYGEEGLYLNEINTIPGSMAKYLWIDPPIEFATLLHDMITEAVIRPAVRYSTAGADGSALAKAGSIAAKLA